MPALTPRPRVWLTSLTVWCGLLSAAGCDIEESPPVDSLRPVKVQNEVQPPENDPSAPAARPAHPDDWFEDVTDRSGVTFTYRNGREGGQLTVVETVGGGVAMLDFDRDGDLDLFFPGGGSIEGPETTYSGRSHALFRNDGDWAFTDITADAGLTGPCDYSLGCSVGDFNRDGFPDLFVTCHGRSRLYENTGRNSFVDATESAGLQIDGLSSASAWADFDRDGWPDLYVVGYLNVDGEPSGFCGDTATGTADVCGPWSYPAAADRLFRNRGDGSFEEVSEQAGLQANGKGLGVVVADINQDGWLDVYVANDASANHLYAGGAEFSFEERGLLLGVAVDQQGKPQGSMGVDFGDIDGDMSGDLFVTNYEMEDNAFYRYLGESGFEFASNQFGLSGTSRPYVGFGTGFCDFDGDGWLDLYVLNGHVAYTTGALPYTQPSFVLRNINGQRFEDVTEQAAPWFSVPHAARGSAVGDLDNDGAPDLVIVQQNAPVTLLKNRKTSQNWFRVELQGTESDPLASGAVVSTSYAGRTIVRHVVAGAGYLSHGDKRILFPAENEAVDLDVTVTWPGGKTEVFSGLTAGQMSRLVEGEGTGE